MKVFLGLMIWIVGFGSVLYFHDSLELTEGKFTAALGFVFFVGILVFFYDRIRSLKVFGGSVEFAEERINKAADKALARIEKDVRKHTDRISALTNQAGRQADQIAHIASGEPATIIDRDGYARVVMVHTDACGTKYAEYTDEKGQCVRVTGK